MEGRLIIKKGVVIVLLVSLWTLGALANGVPKIPKWKPEGKEHEYDVDNLWDAINGAADLYIAYGFERLAIRNFEQKGVGVTLEIYDQGTPINAFGMFRTELPPKAEPLSIGAQSAIVAPYDCMLQNGRYYVRVKATEGKLKPKHCEEIFEAVIRSMPKASALPRELDRLPSKGRIKGSEKFSPKSYLGVSELGNCLSAKYEGKGGKPYEIFAIVEKEGQTTDQLWQSLEAKWKTTEVGSNPALFRKIPYKGAAVVVKTKKGILGVADAGEISEAAALLKRATSGCSK